MNGFIQIYHLLLYQPLLNILVLLYNFLPGNDLGLAVIILTLAIRLILHPFSVKGLKSQRRLSQISPQIKEIQAKYKDRAEQSVKMMELYKKEKISPASGCLPLLLQLPVIIALYQVFLNGLTEQSLANNLYSFVANPGVISQTFLGIFNFSSKIFVAVLAVLAGGAQFWQGKLSSLAAKSGAGAGKTAGGGMDFANMMQKQMLYVMPLISVLIVYQMGAVIGIYWLFSSLLSVGEQYLANRGESVPRRADL